MQSSKGGDAGEWSARKPQLAVQEYKRRGGGYKDDSPAAKDTDLGQWTREQWGTRSGKGSSDDGERYLPKLVRMLLTESEYRRSTEKKQSDSHDGNEQFSDQPDDVKDKAAKIRNDGPTKSILFERARDLDVEGRSNMTKKELLDAIDEATNDNGRDARPHRYLRRKTREELYPRAREADIEGRSKMTKDELVTALADR